MAWPALAALLADQTDTTVAGIVAAFVTAFGTLLALVGWLIKHLFTTTIPKQTDTFAAALADVLKHCREEQDGERAASERRYAEGMAALRGAHDQMMTRFDQLHQDSRDMVHALRGLDNTMRMRSSLADVLPSLDAPAWTKTLDGVLLSWNQAAERALGWRQGEVVGHDLRGRIIPPERRAEEDDVLRRIAAGQTVEEYETDRLRRDGSRARMALKTSAIRDGTGKVVGASTIAREL